jgi:hypothetical protein
MVVNGRYNWYNSEVSKMLKAPDERGPGIFTT